VGIGVGTFLILLRGCQGFTGPFPLPFLISKIKELAQKYNGLLVSGKFDLL